MITDGTAVEVTNSNPGVMPAVAYVVNPEPNHSEFSTTQGWKWKIYFKRDLENKDKSLNDKCGREAG